MNGALDFYRLRFGDAVKRRGAAFNGPCPICGGEPGKSDRFMIWPDRDENLGPICAENHIRGIWHCRRCGESGDAIAYLVKCEGLDFRAALAALGLEGGRFRPGRRPAPEPAPFGQGSWKPQESAPPSEVWRKAAMKLVGEGEKNLRACKAAVEWLAARGLDLSAAAAYRLGWLFPENAAAQGRFRTRESFGLAPKTGADGKVRSRLFIPRGIVIPSFDQAGRLVNLRLRRRKEDLREGWPKYQELEGSARGPLALAGSAPAPLAVWVVVEAELDAMLIHHACGGKIGALAARTNRGKPDLAAHAALSQAARILVALDFDEAGAAGVGFWEETYRQARRWPVPAGKDPGEAFALGVDIREWIAAGLPACIALDEKRADSHEASISQNPIEGQGFSENGQVETSLAGQQNLGNGEEKAEISGAQGGADEGDAGQAEADEGASRLAASGEPCEAGRWFARRGDFSAPDLKALSGALQKVKRPLEDIPLGVARLWLAWRHIPIIWSRRTRRFEPAAGLYARFGQDCALLDAFFWDYPAIDCWFRDHPARAITPRNLFEGAR